MASYDKDDMMIKNLKEIFKIDLAKLQQLGLNQCSSDFVITIYTKFVCDFGASIEDLKEMPLDASADCLNYPDAFQSSYFILKLTQVIQFYIRLISRNTEFTAKDLLFPNKKRTRMFFNLFIDFYSHILVELPLYDEIDNEGNEKKKQMENMRENVAQRKKELDQLKLKNAELNLTHAEELKLISNVKEELQNLKCQKNDLKSELDEYKQKINSLEEDNQSMDLKCCEAKEAIEHIKNEILLDNESDLIDKHESILQELKERALQLTNEIRKINQEILQKKNGDDVVKNSVLPLMKAIDQYQTKLKNFNDEELAISGSFSINIGLKEEHENVKLRINEAIYALEEKRAQSLNSTDKKITTFNQELNQLQQNKEELTRKRREQDIVEADMDGEIKNFSEDMDSIGMANSLFREHVTSTLKEVLENIRRTSVEEISRKLKNVTEDFEF